MDNRSALKITIEESGTGCRVVAVSGAVEREIEIEPLPTDFRQNLVRLQEAILRSPASRRAETPLRVLAKQRQGFSLEGGLGTGAHERMVQEIGSQLFDFVFQKRVLDLYQATLSEKEEAEPLQIRFCINHPELACVPWETLYNKTNRSYVATSPTTPFARSIGDIEERLQFPAERPIRILGMAARIKTINGIPVDSIDVDREQVMIKRALGPLDDGKRVKLCWVPSAKARDLRRMVARGDDQKRWDIFHFIGHGGYDEDRRMGFILVQEGGGSKGARLYTEDLKDILVQPGRTPKLVVLNSCSGAQGQPGELFSSTAAELIQAGIPAVVAMQFEISDNMGIAFSNAFYTYLADDGHPVERALAHTRGDLKADDFGEWISPVLYMRTDDGNLFKVA